MVNADADAEDVVQQTLTGAYRGLAAFRGQSSAKTWLTGIAIRQAAKWLQSRLKNKSVPLDALDDGAAEPSTRSGAAAVDARADVATVLAKLPPDYRQVIILRELQGLTYEEIAQALRVPRGTVESRLHRAREELRRRYEGYLT